MAHGLDRVFLVSGAQNLKTANKNIANISFFGKIGNADMISVQMKLGQQGRKYLGDGYQVILA